MRSVIITLLFLAITKPTLANELWCEAIKKSNSEKNYTSDYIEKQQFGLIIRNYSSGATISRCDFVHLFL